MNANNKMSAVEMSEERGSSDVEGGRASFNMKKDAGYKAAEYVKDGMIVGLGTGSTAYWTVKCLGEKVAEGLDIMGIPTSKETERLALDVGIKLTTLSEYPVLDMTIDGADEVDSDLNLIKGGGGALLREKIVASQTKYQIIIVDSSKYVEQLGMTFPLPVEIVPFSLTPVVNRLKELNCEPTLRVKDGKTFISDNSNYILDCRFPGIKDPVKIEKEINMIPGVVENGLFLNLTRLLVMATEDGVKLIE